MNESEQTKGLYQEQLINLSRNPYHFGEISDHTHYSRAYNRMCGDIVQIYLQVVDNLIVKTSFSGESCVICKASASLMLKAIEGASLNHCRSLRCSFDQFRLDWLSHPPIPEMSALSVMKDYPTRERCMTLPWEALQKAIGDKISANGEEE